MKKTVREQLTVLTVVLLAIFAACTPSLPDYTSDYDLVYTKEDKAFNFGGVQTYFLPDSVVMVPDSLRGQEDHKYDATILASVKSNLDALGWTQLPEGNPSLKADVVVLVTANTERYTSCAAYCWWCYWGWWPGWGYYPPGWGGGWGWGYPSDIVCASYETGTITMTMTNPNGAGDNKLPVVWVGILNGLTEGSEANVQARIDKNIDQAFTQSPYLKQ